MRNYLKDDYRAHESRHQIPERSLCMTGQTKQADRYVDSVLAALNVLDSFLSMQSMTTLQLIQHTGLTRNRVMRLTGTLLHRGYLMREDEHNSYMLGPRIPLLNKVFEEAHSIVFLVRPILKYLAYKTHESASMFIMDGWERVVLAREEGTRSLRYTVSEGKRMDLHAGAAGKVLLAYAPQKTLDEFLSKARLVKRTRHTITNAHELKKDIMIIRRNGFAESAGERDADAAAVAAPVFDGTGSLIGALGIAGPIGRFNQENHELYVKAVIDAAHKLSVQLGWKPEKVKNKIMRAVGQP
jgi:IclR family transcriptional regulator, KDG regulon repressor